MEVEAGDDVADAETTVEHDGNELLGRLRGEFAGEALANYGVEAEPLDEPALHRRRGEDVERDIGAEDGARVRLERQYQRRRAAPFRFFQRPSEHRLVSAMDAVEIADGDDAAAQPLGQAGRIVEAEEAGHVATYRSLGM